MTDHQFIQASKEFFFQYFLSEEMGEKPSLLNMMELVEQYKQTILQDEIKNKTGSGNAFSVAKDHPGSIPDDCTNKTGKRIQINENRTL